MTARIHDGLWYSGGTKYESSGGASTPRSMTPEVSPMLDNDTPTNSSIPESRRPYWSDDHQCYLVPLTRGKVALIDEQDVEAVSAHTWYASVSGGMVYAKRNLSRAEGGGGRRGQYLHHLVAGEIPGLVADHINGDTMDNRRGNIRIASYRINARNQHIHHGQNTSGYRGVSFHKPTSKWRAYIWLSSKQTHLGLFDDAESAAKARDKAALEHFGADAFLNFPQGARDGQ